MATTSSACRCCPARGGAHADLVAAVVDDETLESGHLRGTLVHTV